MAVLSQGFLQFFKCPLPIRKLIVNWPALLTEKASKALNGSKGAPPARALLRTKIFFISCSFWENLANLYIGISPGLAPPPTGNSGSAPEGDALFIKITQHRLPGDLLMNCEVTREAEAVVGATEPQGMHQRLRL